MAGGSLAGTGAVWVVDTKTRAIRRLPGLRPSDLEWRPGTDDLAIAGDMGTDRGASARPLRVPLVSRCGLVGAGREDSAVRGLERGRPRPLRSRRRRTDRRPCRPAERREATQRRARRGAIRLRPPMDADPDVE